MKSITRRLLALILLLITLHPAAAQDDNRVIYIAAPAAPTSAAAQNFLARLAAEFQALNITTFVVDELPDALAASAAIQAQPVMQLLIVQETDSTRLALNLDIHSAGQLPASPVVRLSFDGPVHALPIFDVEADEVASQQAINHLVGVGLALIGDCPAARERLSESARLFAATDTALAADFYLGTCLLREGDLPGAASQFERVVAAAPALSRVPHAAINLAWIDLQLGRENDAVQLMDRLVIATAPDQQDYDDDRRIEALVARSQVYGLSSRFELAVADMDAAIALRPGDAALYVERAQRILLQYEWDQALADYNHALELDAGYAPAYFGRGLVYYAQGPLERALADFERYLTLAPTGVHATEAQGYIDAIQINL